jgi:hypothetical protein
MQTITIEATCVAELKRQIIELDREAKAIIRASHDGQEWAVLRVSPLTDTARSAFPLDHLGQSGDDRKRGQAGVIFSGAFGDDNLVTVINRARRMYHPRD